MTEMFGHGEAFVPLCRELPLRFGTSSVFLDLLGVSPTGKLVLIECKLWRNPEARREVSSRAVGLFHCSFLGLGRRIHRWYLHVFDRLLRCSTAKMKYRGAMLFAILNNSTSTRAILRLLLPKQGAGLSRFAMTQS